MKTKIDKTKSRNKSRSPFFNSKNDPGFFNIQSKLKVGQPGDKYEVEADRVADAIVSSQTENQPFFAPSQLNNIQTKPNRFIQEKPISESITPLIQRQEEEEEEAIQPKLLDVSIQRQEEEEEELQMQPIEEEEEMLQPKSETSRQDTQSATEQLLNGSKGNGSPLNSEIQSQMEGSFGADFSGVKIHTDSTAVQMNKDMGAQAFTTGNDIYFNEGKYRPGSQNGKKLLAHELTHVVQQSSNSNEIINREISTPLDTHVKNADTTKDVSFQVNKVNIVVKPDATSDKKEMENKAETTFAVTNNNSPAAQTKNGKISQIDTTPVPAITVQTVYGKNVSASSTSAYGKGTTATDIQAGETSLGYHEGSHGTDYLTYMKNNAIPQFSGKVGMTIKQYQKAQNDYQKAWDTYTKNMDSYSENLTDCVGTKATFCPVTP